jgi:hypothetical protein
MNACVLECGAAAPLFTKKAMWRLTQTPLQKTSRASDNGDAGRNISGCLALYLCLQKIPGHVILNIPLEEYDRYYATKRH